MPLVLPVRTLPRPCATTSRPSMLTRGNRCAWAAAGYSPDDGRGLAEGGAGGKGGKPQALNRGLGTLERVSHSWGALEITRELLRSLSKEEVSIPRKTNAFLLFASRQSQNQKRPTEMSVHIEPLLGYQIPWKIIKIEIRKTGEVHQEFLQPVRPYRKFAQKIT